MPADALLVGGLVLIGGEGKTPDARERDTTLPPVQTGSGTPTPSKPARRARPPSKAPRAEPSPAMPASVATCLEGLAKGPQLTATSNLCNRWLARRSTSRRGETECTTLVTWSSPSLSLRFQSPSVSRPGLEHARASVHKCEQRRTDRVSVSSRRPTPRTRAAQKCIPHCPLCTDRTYRHLLLTADVHWNLKYADAGWRASSLRRGSRALLVVKPPHNHSHLLGGG